MLVKKSPCKNPPAVQTPLTLPVENRMREFERLQKIEALGLNERQKLAAERYVEHGVKVRAVRDAGYTGNDLKSIAKEVFNNPRVQEYIEILKEDVAGRVDLRIDRVLKELMCIAFSRMDHFASWSDAGVKLKASGELNEYDLSAVQEITQVDTKEGTKIKVKLYSKQAALDRLLDFVSMADGIKNGKGGPALPGSQPQKIVNNLHVRQFLVDPGARNAFEKLANMLFEEKGVQGVPKMTRAMKHKIAELTDSKLIEYGSDEEGAPVDTESGDPLPDDSDSTAGG